VGGGEGGICPNSEKIKDGSSQGAHNGGGGGRRILFAAFAVEKGPAVKSKNNRRRLSQPRRPEKIKRPISPKNTSRFHGMSST